MAGQPAAAVLDELNDRTAVASDSDSLVTRRRSLALLGAGAATLALGACGSGKDRKDLIFATQKNSLPFLAEERGDFSRRLAARGIGPVTWAEFPSGPPLVEALRAGAIDIGLVGETPVIYAMASGADFNYAAVQRFPGLVGRGLLVPGASTIRSPADLKGRKVAYTKGSTAEFVLAVALAQAGLRFTDVVLANLSPGDGQAALANGSVDAWVVWDPFFTIAQLRGEARLVPLAVPGLDTVSYYVTSGSFSRDRADTLRATLDELRTEAAWGNENRQFYRDRLAAATLLPPTVLDGMMRQYKDDLFAVDPITPEIVAYEQKVGDYLLEAGVIPKKVDAGQAAWFDWKPDRLAGM